MYSASGQGDTQRGGDPRDINRCVRAGDYRKGESTSNNQQPV